MLFKIGALKNFVIFTGKHLFWSLFLIKLQALRHADLSKRDSNTSVFMEILRNWAMMFLMVINGKMENNFSLKIFSRRGKWVIKTQMYNQIMECSNLLIKINIHIIVSATRRRRGIKITLCLSALVQKSLI